MPELPPELYSCVVEEWVERGEHVEEPRMRAGRRWQLAVHGRTSTRCPCLLCRVVAGRDGAVSRGTRGRVVPGMVARIDYLMQYLIGANCGPRASFPMRRAYEYELAGPRPRSQSCRCRMRL